MRGHIYYSWPESRLRNAGDPGVARRTEQVMILVDKSNTGETVTQCATGSTDGPWLAMTGIGATGTHTGRYNQPNGGRWNDKRGGVETFLKFLTFYLK